MKKKILYFVSHPIQYFSPLLEKLAAETDLHVYYFSDASITGQKDIGFGQDIKWDTPLLSGYRHSFLKNYSKRKFLDNHFFDVFNPGVIKAIWKSDAPYIIVNGWSYSSTVIAIFFGRLFGKKVWLRAENPLNQELLKSKTKIFIKKIVLKHILFKFFISRCLYIGTQSKDFFKFYGVPEYKLLYTPYSVDNDFFHSSYEALKNKLPGVCSELGLPTDKKIILFSGKYIPKKRPMDLLKAFELLGNQHYALVMVGDGELRKELEEFIARNNIRQVYLTGFINQSAIAKYYAVAAVFVMCSGFGETWGLSVNEAMNFEKPVIVSKTCGCCSDLVKEGENGYAFDEGDVGALVISLKKILENDTFRISAGKKSTEIIKGFSISVIVGNILGGLN